MTADLETVPLGYEELASRARISVQSARRIARRHRWRKVRGNDGRTLVHVPLEYLDRRNADNDADSYDPVLPDVPSDVRADVPAPVPLTVRETEILARLDRTQGELVEMAGKLGASDALVAELRADRDAWRAQAERLVAVGSELQAVREDRERLVADLDATRERMARVEHDRDQALERLNHNIDHLDQVQAEHHTEIVAVRDQLARAESDRNRAVEALAAHLRLPWWRRLLG
jgi:prefoldin subunit 5